MSQRQGNRMLSAACAFSAALLVLVCRPGYQPVWEPVSDQRCEEIRGGNGNCYYIATAYCPPYSGTQCEQDTNCQLNAGLWICASDNACGDHGYINTVSWTESQPQLLNSDGFQHG